MNRRRGLMLAIAAVSVLGGGAMIARTYVSSGAISVPAAEPRPTEDARVGPSSGYSVANEYDSSHVGIAFSYPEGYTTDMSHENDGNEAWHMVTVHRLLADAAVADSSALPSITVSVFADNERLPPRQWVASSVHAVPSASPLTDSLVRSDPAASYTDAEGRNHVAVLHDDVIYYYTVTHPADPDIKAALARITATVSYPRDDR